jgi:uncharacterized protein (TIGR03663 family)
MSELSEPMGLRTGDESLLNRAASVRVRVDRLVLAFATIITAGAIMRFWDLGSRALHHDESLHAEKALELFRGQGYNHEAWMHGPFQFFGTAFSYFLFGVTDYTARIFPALAGVALLSLPFFLRNRMGNLGAILASFAIAFSPTLLYFSRFARNDVYIAFFVLALVVLLWRYIDEQKPLYLYLAGLALGLAFATKESIFINAAVLIVFLDLWMAWRFACQIASRYKLDDIGRASAFLLLAPIAWALTALWPFTGRQRERLGLTEWHPAADFLLVIGTLTLPQFAAAITVPLKGLGVTEVDLGQPSLFDNSRENVLGLLTILSLVAASAAVGLRWNPRVWAIAALSFYVPYALLYTTFFTNLDGFYSGHWGALDYWLSQQDVARGEQPWFYYLMLLPIYEFLPLVIAAPAVFYYIVRGDAFRRFLVFWFFGTVFGLSMAGEKMPWLSVNTTLPLVILAATALGDLLTSAAPNKAADWLQAYGRPLAAACLGVILGALGLFGPDEGALAALRWLGVGLAAGGIIALLLPIDVEGTLARALGRKPKRGRQVLAKDSIGGVQVAAVAASAVLGALLAMSFFSAVRLSYENGDVPREVLVYTQTSPFVPDLVETIDDAAAQSGLGDDLPIVIDGGIEPWLWYLRDYNQVSYQAVGESFEPPAGAVVIVLASNEGAMAEYAADYQEPVRFPLRWWFPEFDTYKTVPTAGVIRTIKPGTVPDFLDWFLGDMVKPSSWENWWDYWRHRIPPNTPGPVEDRLGRHELIAYFPLEYEVEVPESDLPPAQPPVQTEPAAPPPDLPASVELAVAATIGSQGSGPGQLDQPGDVTLDAEGNLYVTEVANNRLQKFDADGNFVASVGGQGDGEGEFMEPWGLATDAQGNVYVADTFNHRIQVFDSDLEFVRMWGSPASSLDNPEQDRFWGPRDVAVDANGDVWVSDGGTNRVLKFTPEGDFIAAFGGRGSGPGQFVEPTAIQITPDGSILVADSGNSRVQRFDAQGQFVAEVLVPGWLYEDAVVKPYLTLLPDGGFIVSDPTQNVLIRFDAEGTPVAALTAEGTALALPRGLAYAGGAVWVAEAGAHQLRLLTLPAEAPAP